MKPRYTCPFCDWPGTNLHPVWMEHHCRPPLDPFTYALEGGRIQLIVGEGATREGLAAARRFIDVLLKAQAQA